MAAKSSDRSGSLGAVDVQRVQYSDLTLDPENPRLPDSVERTEIEMAKYIARETSIEELMNVIGENGFFEGEPLVVYKRKPTDKKFIVIEGNRRLTAVNLLHDPTIYPRRKRIVEIAEHSKFKPELLPILEFKSRDEVLNYLGYRHITGVKEWEPLAKARYLKQLFDRTASTSDPVERYREVAREIGSRRNYVHRTLDALAIYKITEENEFFDIETLDESTISFSLLTTSIGYQSIKDLVCGNEHPVAVPSSINVERLEELVRWLFDRQPEGITRIGESRNIQYLASIAEDKEALESFRSGATLQMAFQKTRGAKNLFIDHLYAALNNLEEANKIKAYVDFDTLSQEITGKIVSQALHLRKSMDDEHLGE